MREYIKKVGYLENAILNIETLKNFKLEPLKEYYMYNMDNGVKEDKIMVLENYNNWILVDTEHYMTTINKVDLFTNSVILSEKRILSLARYSDIELRCNKKYTKREKEKDKKQIKESITYMQKKFGKAGLKKGVINV